MSLVSRRSRGASFRFPDDLATTPVLLPSHASAMRTAFDLAVHGRHHAASLRKLTTWRCCACWRADAPGVTLVPTVVVRDELAAGTLVERCAVPGVRRNASTPSPPVGAFRNRWVKQLVSGQPGRSPADESRRKCV